MVHWDKVGIVKKSGASHGLNHANAAVGTNNPLQGGRKQGASGSG
jgi:hypothetical protein